MFQKEKKKTLQMKSEKQSLKPCSFLILIVDKCGHRGLSCDPNFYLL